MDTQTEWTIENLLRAVGDTDDATSFPPYVAGMPWEEGDLIFPDKGWIVPMIFARPEGYPARWENCDALYDLADEVCPTGEKEGDEPDDYDRVVDEVLTALDLGANAGVTVCRALKWVFVKCPRREGLHCSATFTPENPPILA